jgi:hypothetical protein
VAGAYTQLMRAVMAANPDASDDQPSCRVRKAVQDGTAQRILSVKAGECLRVLVQRAVAQADTAERRRRFFEERTQRAEAYRAELLRRMEA